MGLYYLQSRYYDPEIGRFLNADAFISTGQGELGNNMFAYCANNPIINYDPCGNYYCTLGAETYGFLGHTLSQYIGGGSSGGGFAPTKDDLIPDITTTTSLVATSAVGDVTASKSWSISADSMGYHAIQESDAFGITSGTEAGFGLTRTFTNAKSVFDLEGESTNIGFTIGYIFVISVDFITFSPASTPGITKFGISAGLSFGFAMEVHSAIANTETILYWEPGWWKK